jgi:hypothetical protein
MSGLEGFNNVFDMAELCSLDEREFFEVFYR